MYRVKGLEKLSDYANALEITKELLNHSDEKSAFKKKEKVVVLKRPL